MPKQVVIYSTKEFPQEQYQLSFDGFLFNEPEHLALKQGLEGFWILLVENQMIYARIHLFVQENKALSGFKAPFGSVEMNKQVSYEEITCLIEETEKFCKTQSYNKIQIVCYPFSYANEISHILTQILMHKGYQVYNSEICHYFRLLNTSFEERLHHSEKRRLKKCEEAGFMFEQLKEFDLEEVYEFVKGCRFRKGFPISMIFSDFRKLFEAFPDKHLIFAVKAEKKIIALTVIIEVNSKILYNFYPADHENYLSFSPTVYLMKGVYNYALHHQYKLLDLGISTDGGEPNFGLIRFKKNLGAKSCLKLSFVKNL